jgi:hypothetical protein
VPIARRFPMEDRIQSSSPIFGEGNWEGVHVYVMGSY